MVPETVGSVGDGVWVWGDEDHLEEEEEGEGDDRQREEAHLASKSDQFRERSTSWDHSVVGI